MLCKKGGSGWLDCPKRPPHVFEIAIDTARKMKSSGKEVLCLQGKFERQDGKYATVVLSKDTKGPWLVGRIHAERLLSNGIAQGGLFAIRMFRDAEGKFGFEYRPGFTPWAKKWNRKQKKMSLARIRKAIGMDDPNYAKDDRR